MSKCEVSIFSDGVPMTVTSLADLFGKNLFTPDDLQALFRAFSDRSEFTVNVATFGGGAEPLIAVKLYEPGDEAKTLADVLQFKPQCYGTTPPAERPIGAKVSSKAWSGRTRAIAEEITLAQGADVAPPVFGRGSVSLSCLHNGVQLTSEQARALASFIESALESGYGCPTNFRNPCLTTFCGSCAASPRWEPCSKRSRIPAPAATRTGARSRAAGRIDHDDL